MKYKVGEYEATHSNPIWRDRSNFIFVAHLGVKEGKNEWEQLWGKKTDVPQRFILCCIPFFAKDISLGDEVETDKDFIFKRVIRHSGQTTFRIWFGGQSIKTRKDLISAIKSMEHLMEWSSENLLAISVLNEAKALKLANYLKFNEEKGLLQYETGKTV